MTKLISIKKDVRHLADVWIGTGYETALHRKSFPQGFDRRVLCDGLCSDTMVKTAFTGKGGLAMTPTKRRRVGHRARTLPVFAHSHLVSLRCDPPSQLRQRPLWHRRVDAAPLTAMGTVWTIKRICSQASVSTSPQDRRIKASITPADIRTTGTASARMWWHRDAWPPATI